jgi:nucleotide-binding universal stress UspA family protein
MSDIERRRDPRLPADIQLQRRSLVTGLRENAMITLKNILVATDFSEPAEAALVYGRALARTFRATLHVVHVRENVFLHAVTADPRSLDEAARRWVNDRLTDDDRQTLRARAVLETSNVPEDAIVSYARRVDIDLIVIGTHGRGGLARALMGSVAEHVVRTAPCPVLTVRHPEREFVRPDTQEIAPVEADDNDVSVARFTGHAR